MKQLRRILLSAVLFIGLSIFATTLAEPNQAKAFTYGTKPAQIYFMVTGKSVSWVNVSGLNQNNKFVTWYGNANGTAVAKTTNWWWRLEGYGGVGFKFWVNGEGEKSCGVSSASNGWFEDYNWRVVRYDPVKYGSKYPCQVEGGWY